jgi:hypothetical protein
MVENLVKEKIDDYQAKKIKTSTRLIIEISKIYNNDVEKVFNVLKPFGFSMNIIIQQIDSYLILLQGKKIDIELKKSLERSEILDENESLISDLAKMYFFCDSISLDDNGQVVIKKDISIKDEDDTLEIDVPKAIYMTLQKIKYNKIDDKAILKIQELGKSSKYSDLMNLLIKSVECSSKIKMLDNDQCKMSIDELKEFLK